MIWINRRIPLLDALHLVVEVFGRPQPRVPSRGISCPLRKATIPDREFAQRARRIEGPFCFGEQRFDRRPVVCAKLGLQGRAMAVNIHPHHGGVFHNPINRFGPLSKVKGMSG